jgi:hypothetical protein
MPHLAHVTVAADQARAALLDADAALETFGTHRGPRIRDAELTGSPRLVTDVLVAALSDAAERFDDALESYGRGETSLAELQRSEERLAALLALFAAHEGEHAV